MKRGTRARRGAPMDAQRIGMAVAHPGIDGRVWSAVARVDDGDDAVRWDADLGLVADVTIVGGPLDGEGPIPARVGRGFLADGALLAHPLPRGSFVVVELGHDPNDVATIVARLFAAGATPPESVNGETIDAALLARAHVLRSSHDAELELDGNVRAKMTELRAIAERIFLVDENATQPFVRGTDWQQAINGFMTDLLEASGSLLPSGPPATPVTAAQVSAYLGQLGTAIATFLGRTYLSTQLNAE